jgi:hypothetical protein
MPAELEVDNLARFATELNIDGNSIVNATGANTFGSDANTVVVFTAGAQGSLVDSIRVLSDDSAAKILHLYVKIGANIYPISAVTVALGSGTNGTALPVDPLSNANASHLPISNQGKRYLRLPAGATIIAGVFAAMTAAKTMWVQVTGLDFEA